MLILFSSPSALLHSINVDTLNFQYVGMVDDCWTMSFPKTKTGQAGEKENAKHVYANPLEPAVCSILNNALHWSCNARRAGTHKMYEGQEQAARYNTGLTALIEELRDELELLGAAGEGSKLTSHGLRKGAGTYCACGSTCAPPPTSIMLRADWALGAILSRYLKFADAGDQYVGRVVSGLPCDTVELATLPPHFPMEFAELFAAAAKDQFPDLYAKYPHLRGNLVSGIASLVYHHDWLQDNLGKEMPGTNPFFTTSLFRNKDRLAKMRSVVTIDADRRLGEVKASGVPPHVNIMRAMAVQVQQLEDTREELRALTEEVRDFAKHAVGELVAGVVNAVELDCANRGVVTISALQKVIADRDQALMGRFEELLTAMPNSMPVLVVVTSQAQGSLPAHFRTFMHTADQRHSDNPQLWIVPENFCFPDAAKTTLDSAFSLWFGGDPSNGISPFRKFKPDSFGLKALSLQKKGISLSLTYSTYYAGIVRNQEALTEWRRIMLPMEAVVIARLTGAQTAAELNEAYDIALVALKQNFVGYAFKKPRHTQLGIGTWAKYMKPSMIMAKGTPDDRKSLAKRRRVLPHLCTGDELAVTQMLEKGEQPHKIAKK